MGKGAKKRAVILERAVSIVSQSGLAGLTIGGLAKELKLSKSGLIAHFGTKEALDLAVLQAGAALFSEHILVPASRSKPGEPRVRALFDGWLRYANLKQLPGGDLFFAATAELDDRPGVCRYYLARVQKDWLQSIGNATREAMGEGHFRETLDPGQIAFNVVSILHGYHVYSRLLNDPLATRRSQTAFESLIARARDPGYTPPMLGASARFIPIARARDPGYTPPEEN